MNRSNAATARNDSRTPDRRATIIPRGSLSIVIAAIASIAATLTPHDCVYPHATPAPADSAALSRPGLFKDPPEKIEWMAGAQMVTLTTRDKFAKVAAFYRGLGGTGFAVPMSLNGKRISAFRKFQDAGFILDTAATLASAKRYVVIRSPKIGSVRQDKKGKLVFEGVEPICTIELYNRLVFETPIPQDSLGIGGGE